MTALIPLDKVALLTQSLQYALLTEWIKDECSFDVKLPDSVTDNPTFQAWYEENACFKCERIMERPWTATDNVCEDCEARARQCGTCHRDRSARDTRLAIQCQKCKTNLCNYCILRCEECEAPHCDACVATLPWRWYEPPCVGKFFWCVSHGITMEHVLNNRKIKT